MGCITSSPEDKLAKEKNKQIEQNNLDDNYKNEKIKKLLLLGAGESGKSTFFKQIKLLYVNEYSKIEIQSYKMLIHQNILTNIQLFIEYIKNHNPPLGPIANQESLRIISNLSNDSIINSSIADHLINLWNDENFKYIWNNRSNYQVEDSVEYFLQKVQEIASKDYLPSNMDIFKLRVRTTGILEMFFSFKDTDFLLVDVGGQRNERKKWIHCFSDVTAIIFVAAINEYDMKLFEDNNVNRMTETLTLFKDTINNPSFKNMTIILFLNKCDLLLEKIKTSPINQYFQDYNGKTDDYQSIVEFIRQKFLGCNANKKRQIFTHITCATDTSSVANVFASVKESLVVNMLSQTGMIDFH